MAGKYLVSVPDLKAFHSWCSEMGKKPDREAVFIPPGVHSKARNAILEKHSADHEGLLIGEFADHEKLVLLAKPGDAVAAPKKAAKAAPVAEASEAPAK